MNADTYPQTPMGVPPDLTKPTASYKRQTAAAVMGVVVFFIFYFGLTGWLGLVTYRAISGFHAHPGRTFFIGIPAGFLFLVLAKGLFARKKMSRDSLLEVTEDEQPEFFAFIHRIADETGARRPAKVYLSADVNAAVFLDVGLINLIIPTRKNLIVGLGLVNSLTLDEFKAVVAHEFGHFAQRSMGVGQWVYIAQGFVSDLIARRDILDRFIRGLSYQDIRIAWVGWLMRILVWAVRAVVDQFFRFVILLGRALSRQMEFQADLVSVSVAGSDSLVHALHRLGAADRGWGEAANFVAGDARRGKRTADLFAIQTRFVERYREVHALADHGVTPSRSATDGSHRVFGHAIADAPRMWSTHPSNKDREENCKQLYVPSTLDTRPAWTVFRDEATVRKRMTAHFIELVLKNNGDQKPAQPAPVPVQVPLEDSLARVDEIFGRPALDRRYQGLYTTVQLTRALPAGAP
ncbi:MAG: M48 family metallopeptidase, partial [Myxococcota bacterium]